MSTVYALRVCGLPRTTTVLHPMPVSSLAKRTTILSAILGCTSLMSACGGGDSASMGATAGTPMDKGASSAWDSRENVAMRSGDEVLSLLAPEPSPPPAAIQASATQGPFATAATLRDATVPVSLTEPALSTPSERRSESTAAAPVGPITDAVLASTDPAGAAAIPIWRSDFTNGVSDWPFSGANWGDFNRSFTPDPAVAGQAMSVYIAKGSTDPYTMHQAGQPVAGQGMRLTPRGFSAEAARLSFMVKLPANFQPALGGKIGPGLCGGTCNGGGNIPNGFDGWSARIGFDETASGVVYAYLPTSVDWGTHIGKIPLVPGRWMRVVQELRLNSLGRADGSIKVWVDDQLVIDRQGLAIRYTNVLKIDGIYFDTFFGGQSAEYAAPHDTVIKYAEFALWAL